MAVSTVDSTSAYEQVAAGYPSWRVTHAGDLGQWVASHEDVVELVAAATVERLLARLAIAELTRLQEAYKARWGVWRSSGGSWMATARIAGVEPTLMCGSPVELEERMRNPGTWVSAHRTRGDRCDCGARNPTTRPRVAMRNPHRP